MTKKNFEIISVTGTKGKSSVVQLLASVMDIMNPTVLRVDTTGAYLGGEKLADVAESMEIFGYGTAVTPGKYLLLASRQAKWSGQAVLECSIGCASYGLGYKWHDVGIFTNIFTDHIGKMRKTRQDLASAKSFIAKYVKTDGSLVYNADEPLIETVARAHANRINLIPVGMQQPSTWSADTTHMYFHGQPVLALSDLSWLIDPSNRPYVYNALFVAGALQARGMTVEDIARLLPRASLDVSTGRLEVLGTPAEVRILLTFAHEKMSLEETATLARRLAGKNRCMASIRIAHRPHDRMVEFAEACLGYDDLVVYEKTLPYESSRKELQGPKLQKVLKSLGRSVEYIADEKAALTSLVDKAEPGDVIVHIVNGDTKKSREIARAILT